VLVIFRSLQYAEKRKDVLEKFSFLRYMRWVTLLSSIAAHKHGVKLQRRF